MKRGKRVALILGYRKRLIGTEQFGRLVAEKESASYGKPANPCHIAIAQMTAKWSDPPDVELSFDSAHGCFGESNRKTHTGVQQETIVCKVLEMAPIPIPVESYVS